MDEPLESVGSSATRCLHSFGILLDPNNGHIKIESSLLVDHVTFDPLQENNYTKMKSNY